MTVLGPADELVQQSFQGLHCPSLAGCGSKESALLLLGEAVVQVRRQADLAAGLQAFVQFVQQGESQGTESGDQRFALDQRRFEFYFGP